MDEVYDQILLTMERCHRTLAAQISRPVVVGQGSGFVFRYEERGIRQAIVQKLARVISGLHAARLLLTGGFLQEHGVLQRTLDEFNEDIIFLAYGAICGDISELHEKYLAAFFEEEFDNPDSALKSTQKRDMISRQKIRAYLARIKETGLDPSNGVEIFRTIDKTYSGYIHGASPHIMEMYYGSPPTFYLRGMLDTDLADQHREDLWNYVYRSLGSCVVAAKAFGHDDLFQSVLGYMRAVARLKGEHFAHPPGAQDS